MVEPRDLVVLQAEAIAESTGDLLYVHSTEAGPAEAAATWGTRDLCDLQVGPSVESWSAQQSHDLGPVVPETGLQVLDRQISASVQGAVNGLNQGRIVCEEGLCITYSNSSNAYYLLYRCDKEAEASRRFGFEVANVSGSRRSTPISTSSATWSTGQSHGIGATVDTTAGVRVLDRMVCTSVSTAVERLNGGQIVCDDGMCIVFSASTSAYFVLWRSDMKETAFQKFSLNSANPSEALTGAQVGPTHSAPPQSDA